METWSMVALVAFVLQTPYPAVASEDERETLSVPALPDTMTAQVAVTQPTGQSAPESAAGATEPTDLPSAASEGEPMELLHTDGPVADELAPLDMDGTVPDELASLKRSRRADRGGGGIGLTFGWLWVPMSDLNDIARQMNYGEGFSGGPVQMSGLRGFGYIGRHFRVGGMAADGSKRIRDRGQQFQRDLILTVEQVGLTLEYIYPTRRWEFYGGGMLGSGAYRLTHSQTSLDVFNTRQDWDETIDQFSSSTQTTTFTKRFAVNYLAASPWVGVKFKLVPWFAVDANVGYQWGRAGAGRWEFGDSRLSLANSPAMDGAGLSARLEATFGMFPQ